MPIKTKFELLPNEIVIECFQYLNAPDLFYTFDRLNYRFYTLIRNISLHVNFEQFKKSSFNEFCQIILSNPEIKQNIISLKLSNEGTLGQNESFLSLFSLNEFIHLRSLSLNEIDDDNAKQVLPMLPLLSDLYSFSCTYDKFVPVQIIPGILKSKVRILTAASFFLRENSIYETLLITSLTISVSSLRVLRQLFNYTSMLKYLKIEHLQDNSIMNIIPNIPITNNIHLKQLIVNNSTVNFEVLEELLKLIPNLKIFSISSSHKIQLVDANRWQHLIESSVPYLHTFNFNFNYSSSHSYDEKLIKFQQFQTDFWHKQHQWYTNYEIDDVSASIYTMPYLWNEYKLTSTMNRYSHSNEFDNVKNLALCTIDDSPYYFRNVQSLSLINECDYNDKTKEYQLPITQIKFLHMIVNLSNIKHLTIDEKCYMTSSLLLKILKEIPNVLSLIIRKDILISFLKNRQLCKYLNKNIKILDIATDLNDKYIQSNEIDFLNKTFSNLEQLHCNIEKLDHLLLIIAKCSTLSILKLGVTSNQIYSWIQVNAPTLNIYIDPILIEYDDI